MMWSVSVNHYLAVPKTHLHKVSSAASTPHEAAGGAFLSLLTSIFLNSRIFAV